MKVNRLTKILLLMRSAAFLVVFAVSGSISAMKGNGSENAIQIVAIGDSLTAGYGLPAG